MIRFDFTVDDSEAEAIFDAMQSQVVNNIMHMVELVNEPEKVEALRHHNDFVINIISKMKNTKVG